MHNAFDICVVYKTRNLYEAHRAKYYPIIKCISKAGTQFREELKTQHLSGCKNLLEIMNTSLFFFILHTVKIETFNFSHCLN